VREHSGSKPVLQCCSFAVRALGDNGGVPSSYGRGKLLFCYLEGTKVLVALGV
jgi:hypothetical protein